MKLADTSRPTKVRYGILAAIFINVVINYMDRSNISVAATAITNDFQLSPVQLGIIFSAFGWSYAALQIPGGILVDKYGPRLVYAISLLCWSLATLFQGVIKSFNALFLLRMATGAFEAPAFPANNRVVTSWFPDKERATAIAVYTSGQFIGLAFLTPVLVTIQYYMGWRGLFIITGLTGMLWGIVWYYIYRDPLQHAKVNKSELQYIKDGGGVIDAGVQNNNKTKTFFKRSDLLKVFSYRKLWGIYLGQFAINSTLWFFLTWFPTYLVQYRGLSFIKSGFLASVPFLAACAGLLLSGFLSDYLLKKGVSAGVARKAPVIIGLLLSVCIIGANYVTNTTLIILFMSIAFFGNGFASIAWIFVSAIAPVKLIGLTGGVFNFIGQLASIVIPIVLGVLAKDGNFAPALSFIGILAFAGACSYIFLVGKVERIVLDEPLTAT
jgi:ACS family D-galactonate transporter-like MFS transporter